MLRYLRSDATPLSAEEFQDIIKAKNSMKRASEVMAKKYKISSRRVYQIWRGVHPQIDPKDITLYPPTDPQINLPINPTKKNIISPTESSEDVLDLFKKNNSDIEKIRESGHALRL
ncbi:6169_t:CDS:2 [Acaulospora morrowiae]|uniref:6169_t:CDS:1 n=1 Tax=Acaulospora morrowiae TaxID=94023 RepID=A0A9N9NC61_9GLOM|nr:6169_t:CDS:2 [Acaulospora morrowiae]